jgi:hypothetical protein
MTSTSVRFASAALLLVGGVATAGCARSSAKAPVALPARSTAVVRYDLARPSPAPCAAPTPLPVVVAAAPKHAPVVEYAPAPVFEPAPAYEPAPATSLIAPAPARDTVVPPVRLINVTCPVMLGNPVDPGVTSLWNGRLVAFSDSAARARFEESPMRFTGNLPGYASGTSSDSSAPSGARVLAGPPLAAYAAPLLRRGSTVPLAPPSALVGSPDGDEEEAPAECGDEECPGGNCRLPR